MESGLAARNGGRIGLVALVAILLLGTGLRVGEAWNGRDPVYDAAAYAAIASNLGEGNGFTAGPEATQPSSNYSPGLPLFVAGLYEAMFGVHERIARVALALIGSLAVLFTYLLGRRLGRALNRPGSNEVDSAPAPPPRWLKNPPRAAEDSSTVWPALLGALAVAVYPALIEYQGMMMGEPLAAALLSGGALAALWAWDGRAGRGRHSRGADAGGARARLRWLVPGALFGALALVRPECLAVAVLVAGAIFAREARFDWRRSLLRAAIFFGALAVVIAPWTIRNAVALHRFVPVSTGGGQVLFAGTYLPSGGNPERVGEEVVAHHPELFGPHAVRNLRLEQILSRLAQARYPAMESDEALSKMGREQLWDEVSEEPLEYADFVATKIGRIWSHGPRNVMREPGWEALHWALLALGFLGLAALARRRRWEALLIGTIFLAITAISALLVASPRRVLVMIPLLAALAGAGAAWLWTQPWRRRLAGFRSYSPHNSPVATSDPDSLGAP